MESLRQKNNEKMEIGNKMIVSLVSCDEILVFDKEDEKGTIADYFKKNNGRDITDYDRVETAKGSVFRISTVLKNRVDRITPQAKG